MQKARDLLALKDQRVITIEIESTVLDAVRRMNDHKVGAVVVTRDGAVAGIFTERDVLRRVVAAQRDPAHTEVADVMTGKVICCNADTSVDEIRSIMADQRIRHLPVVDRAGQLVGMLSIGDLNAAAIKNGQVQIQYMEEYLYGRV